MFSPLVSDNLKAINHFLSLFISLSFSFCFSVPRLFAPHLHPQTECGQTYPEICTLNWKNQLRLNSKPLGSTRNMLPVQSAFCYHGNTGRRFEHDDCKMTPPPPQTPVSIHHPARWAAVPGRLHSAGEAFLQLWMLKKLLNTRML